MINEISSNQTGQHDMIPSKELISCYLTSDIFVSAALVEGLSLVSIEASASGLPLVMTDIPGNKDIVLDGTNGYLVPPKNTSALAEKIIALLKDDKLREKMGRSAREISKSYDWSIVAEQYINLYKKIIN